MGTSDPREGRENLPGGSSGQPTRETQPSPPEEIGFGQDVMNSLQSVSQPVELSELSPANPKQTDLNIGAAESSKEETNTPSEQPISPETAEASSSQNPNPDSIQSPDAAIGPATDRPALLTQVNTTGGPRLIITLLLHSTDTRHPYTINEKYLKKRNVTVLDNDPVNMSVYTLKELIWRDWREEWEPRPSTPASIRLIHMGRMLDDKTHLKDSRFVSGDATHVVHMTVKPQEVVDDEDARIAKGSGRGGDGNERSPGCRCILM